jgi:hypothetical protein
LVYADGVNILGGSICTIKKNTEALVVASKEIGLEVNAEKAMCVVVYRDQNAEKSHNINIDNKSFERMEHFRYVGTNLTNQNSIWEEIKSRLQSGNACYHSVQDLLSCSLLSRNTDSDIQNYNFACCCVWVQSWSLILREECRLGVFENRVRRRIFGPERDQLTGEWRRLHGEELNGLSP